MTRFHKPIIGCSGRPDVVTVCCGVFLAACMGFAPVRAHAQDNLVVGDIPMDRFDTGHEVVQEDKRQQIRMVEIFPLGQLIDNWTELITIQSLGKKKHPGPRAAVDAVRQMLMERCPNLMWNEIDAKAEDIVYEWRIENCAPEADQHEVARFLASKSTVFRLAYTARTKQLSPEERRHWIAWLQGAHLVK